MSLRIGEQDFFHDTFRTRERGTLTNREQADCESAVESLFQAFLKKQSSDGLEGPVLNRNKHVSYLLKALRHLSGHLESLDASRPWLVYWITQALYLLDEQLTDVFINDICDFLKRCEHPDGGFGGGPGQIAHLAPTYAAVNALCLLRSKKAYQVIDRKKLSTWLKTIRDPSNGSFSLHLGGESDIRATYCAASVATLCQLEDLPNLFHDTAEWVARCQTYEGGFGACPGAEAHGGYSFCGYATLCLLDRESICDRDSLLRWTVNRQMAFEGGFQGRTNKLVDGCYSFWVGALVPLIQAVARRTSTRDNQGVNTENSASLFDNIAAQEYVLLCCQSNLTGGFTDRPKADGRGSDLYHTCYCLSGLSLFQNGGLDQTTAVCGGDQNRLRNTHALFNIGPECVRDAMDYYSQEKQLKVLLLISLSYLSMAAGKVPFKSSPKQMSDSWIVIDDQDESDFVVIEDEHVKQPSPIPLIPSPKVSPQVKRPLGQNNNKPANMAQPSSAVKQNKKRKWKVLYSLPSTGIKTNVDDSNLDSFVMDQHAQLLDKRDLFSNQQRIVKVK